MPRCWWQSWLGFLFPLRMWPQNILCSNDGGPMCACQSPRSVARALWSFVKLLVLAPLIALILLWWWLALAASVAVWGTVLVIAVPGLVLQWVRAGRDAKAGYIRHGDIRSPPSGGPRSYQEWPNKPGPLDHRNDARSDGVANKGRAYLGD